MPVVKALRRMMAIAGHFAAGRGASTRRQRWLAGHSTVLLRSASRYVAARGHMPKGVQALYQRSQPAEIKALPSGDASANRRQAKIIKIDEVVGASVVNRQ